MADITYDIENLVTAKKSIDNLIETLENDDRNLSQALSKLKAEWKTDAGKAFFEGRQNDWSEYVKKYVKKLDGISDMLQQAIHQYEGIDSEVKNLKV